MPRPSKHVSPDTLGGRIRAAREHLHLSLAEVADGRYSTSLISQIERNRIEPSLESLRHLAERLQLSFDELNTLAQQHREAAAENNPDKLYEDLRIEAAQLLANKNITEAIFVLDGLYFPHISQQHRWRLAALRGHCYFEQRKFLKAQQDFVYAANEQPSGENLPSAQKQEYLLLHLHLASTYRELQQINAAIEQFTTTLSMINRDTPLGHVAETHWGVALATFTQANMTSGGIQNKITCKEKLLHRALEHAETAYVLYRSIDEQLRAAAVMCQIAQIEQTLGERERASQHLKELLNFWKAILDEPEATTAEASLKQQEAAGVVSAAACALANIELEAGHPERARPLAEIALTASKRSYKLRRADAYIMLGRILEQINPKDPEAEKAFRQATRVLADTERIPARIQAHMRLGRHLFKIGKTEEAEQEIEQAHHLSTLVFKSDLIAPTEDATPT